MSYDDLSSNFFLAESDIGRNRADVSIPKLAEFNPYYVNRDLLNRPHSDEILNEFAVIMLVQQPLSL